MDFKDIIKKAAGKRIIFTAHALDEMNDEVQIITVAEVKSVIFKGEIIEHYPEDKRGHSCLMLGFGEKKRPLHIVCAPKEEYLAIITAYVPDVKEWKNNFKTRKK
jgi:hypothetical protein